MQVTLEIDERRFRDLAQARMDELFSDDARFRESPVRSMIRRITDDVAVEVVRQARAKIEIELPAMAETILREEIRAGMRKEAAKMVRDMRKLYSGFDPARLSEQERAWVLVQAEKRGAKTPEDAKP
jgi:sRNA-binding carbon storage regulator CsrA